MCVCVNVSEFTPQPFTDRAHYCSQRPFVRSASYLSLGSPRFSSSAALIYTEIHKGPKRSFLSHPRYVNSIVEQLVSGTGRSPLESRGRRYRIAGGGRKSVWGGRGGGDARRRMRDG